MKAKILTIFCSVLFLLGCSSTSDTKTSAPATASSNAPTATVSKTTTGKDSIYDGVSATKVKQCMGAPVAIFSANNNTYWRYFTPNRCEVLFIINDDKQQVVDMKYLFPHAFTRYGYAVSEKQCPLAQKECLLSK